MTPKELTQVAYDLGVAGVNINAIAVRIVDLMESSGQYYGPYNNYERVFLEQYMVEEVTPDRIEYCRLWLSRYVYPVLQPLMISNSTFYIFDGPGTPIGAISGTTPGSTLSVVDGPVYLIGNSVYILTPLFSPGTFDVTFREILQGSGTRDTIITFNAIVNPNSGDVFEGFIFTFDDIGGFEYILTFDVEGVEYVATGDE